MKEPIIWKLNRTFDVVTNIRGASIKGKRGLISLEMEGEEKEVEKALKWLSDIGIQIEPIEQDIVGS